MRSITWQPVPAPSATTCVGASPVEAVPDVPAIRRPRRTSLELRALTVGQEYWVAIESFDENGVSTLSPPVAIR